MKVKWLGRDWHSLAASNTIEGFVPDHSMIRMIERNVKLNFGYF